MKYCASCDTNKALKEFHKNRSRYDGYGGYCKACSNAAKTISIQTKMSVIRDLKDVPCFDCGKKYHWIAMDFHHRDEAIKEYNVAKMRGMKLEKILKEINKCDVLCAICHRMRHYNEGWEVDDGQL